MGSNFDGLIFRADANPQIGIGHIMRCLALSQAWQAANGRSIFAIGGRIPTLEKRLKEEKAQIFRLKKGDGGEDDVQETINLAYKHNVSWVVVDGYQFAQDYQQNIKQAGLQLLFIDDYGHSGQYCADLILNQNINADESLYYNRAFHSKLLLGTNYVLLRQEFLSWHCWQREIPPVARRLLVTLGGADPDNVTLKVIYALQQVEMEDLEAIVVIGGSNPHNKALRSAIEILKMDNSKCKIRLEFDVRKMPELMAWADMAITAGGSTNWELAFMGLPSLVLSLKENQRTVAEGLASIGIVVNLGRHEDVVLNMISTSTKLLANDPERRSRMSQCGRRLIDGLGVKRVLARIKDQGFVFRPVISEDCHLVWEWANDSVTRENSFSSDPIPWEDHIAWFNSKLADPHVIFYIIQIASVPIGQIWFRIDGQEAIVSINIAPAQRGKGYSGQIIRMASMRLIKTTMVRKIHAYIKPGNMTSIKAFIQGGYARKDMANINGNEAFHFIFIE
jgi:UDP-2,4-diacetamido-2,4,6-trideoxy-beta-L-altropyranose hydrolase